MFTNWDRKAKKMKCLIKQKPCKFWNEIIGCDDHSDIYKCEEKENKNGTTTLPTGRFPISDKK